MPPMTEQGNANPYAAAWVADDPASSLRFALDVLEGNSVRQAEPLLRWALGHLRNTVVLRGHTDWVMSASFHPNGRVLLTACLDHKIRVFAAADGEQLASFDIGAAPRFQSGSPKFSSDGTLLIVPGFDGLLHIGPWEGAISLPVFPLSADIKVSRAALARDNSTVITGHTDGTVRMSPFSGPGEAVRLAGIPGSDPIACVAISPDGKHAAAGTRDGHVCVWNLTSPGRVVVLPAHDDWVNTVEFSPDNRLLASASDDTHARLYSVSDGRLVADVGTHTDRVNTATFSPNGELMATTGVDKAVWVHDTRTGDQRAVMRGVADEVQSAEFSADGTLLAMASVDGTAQICYTHNGRPLFKLTDHKGAIFTVAFDPAGTTVVTASADQTARLWDVKNTGQVFWGHQAQVNTAAFGDNGKIVATAGEDGTVRIHNTEEGRQIALLAEHDGGVNSAAFDNSSTHLVTAGQDRTARVTAWQTADAPVVLHHALEVDAAVFTSAADHVITSTRLEAVLWHWQTGERVTTFKLPPEERAANPFIAIIGVDISRDNSTVVTAHYDAARLWDAATGALLHSLEHAGIVYTAVFSYDSSKVITASGGDGNVRIWDAKTGELLRTLVGPSRQLRCAALSQDGRLAAAGDTVGRLIVSSVIDEQVAAVLQQHTDLIMSVAFSPDGTLLATASDDGTVKVVAVDSFLPLEELVPIARQRLRRAAP